MNGAEREAALNEPEMLEKLQQEENSLEVGL